MEVACEVPCDISFSGEIVRIGMCASRTAPCGVEGIFAWGTWRPFFQFCCVRVLKETPPWLVCNPYSPYFGACHAKFPTE